MLWGYLPFDGEENEDNNNTLFKNIIGCNLEFPDFNCELGKYLITKILTLEPNKRLTIDEIKKHPFYLKGKSLCKLDYSLIEELIIKKRHHRNNINGKNFNKNISIETYNSKKNNKNLEINIIDNYKNEQNKIDSNLINEKNIFSKS